MNQELDLSNYLQRRFNFLAQKIRKNPSKPSLRLTFNDELNSAVEQGYQIRLVEGVYLVEKLDSEQRFAKQ